MKTQRIAVIGGGISGLAIAYHLTHPVYDFDCEVDIYEANDYLGGNADTAPVDLGEIKDVLLAADASDNGHMIRCADLGVDDFNGSTYKSILAVMEEIGFAGYRRLEDTACFFTLDGAKVLTVDDALLHGTSDPEIAIDAELDRTYKDFMKAAVDAVKDEAKTYKRCTVGKFFEEYVEDPPQEAERDRLIEMRDCLLFPRINAMYFFDDVGGPADMPLRAVMKYYEIQEGYGGEDESKPERNYSIHGAQDWIDALAKWLRKNREGRINIRRNAQAQVCVEENQVMVSVPPEPDTLGLAKPEFYDKVVMTCHADDAMRAIKEGLTQDLINILDKIRYTNSIAVAHTFAGVLAPDRNAWRTYNVLIRQGQAIHPYSMTYVMNRHQNDAATWVVEGEHGRTEYKTTKYNKAGMPQYFVTLNPVVPIPDEYVLRIPQGKQRKPAGYFKQFRKGEEVLPGWRNLGANRGENEPAIGWFKHNVLNFDCLDAQEELCDAQGGKYKNLYFSGGWTKGAGLHEECWNMGKEVVEKILGVCRI